jgi:hypothetical protein
VTSEVIPTIQRVHRKLAVGSRVLTRWMWKGRLTNTNDHANEPKNIVTGSS